MKTSELGFRLKKSLVYLYLIITFLVSLVPLSAHSKTICVPRSPSTGFPCDEVADTINQVADMAPRFGLWTLLITGPAPAHGTSITFKPNAIRYVYGVGNAHLIKGETSLIGTTAFPTDLVLDSGYNFINFNNVKMENIRLSSSSLFATVFIDESCLTDVQISLNNGNLIVGKTRWDSKNSEFVNGITGAPTFVKLSDSHLTGMIVTWNVGGSSGALFGPHFELNNSLLQLADARPETSSLLLDIYGNVQITNSIISLKEGAVSDSTGRTGIGGGSSIPSALPVLLKVKDSAIRLPDLVVGSDEITFDNSFVGGLRVMGDRVDKLTLNKSVIEKKLTVDDGSMGEFNSVGSTIGALNQATSGENIKISAKKFNSEKTSFNGYGRLDAYESFNIKDSIFKITSGEFRVKKKLVAGRSFPQLDAAHPDIKNCSFSGEGKLTLVGLRNVEESNIESGTLELGKSVVNKCSLGVPRISFRLLSVLIDSTINKDVTFEFAQESGISSMKNTYKGEIEFSGAHVIGAPRSSMKGKFEQYPDQVRLKALQTRAAAFNIPDVQADNGGSTGSAPNLGPLEIKNPQTATVSCEGTGLTLEEFLTISRPPG